MRTFYRYETEFFSRSIANALYQCSVPVFEGLLPDKEDRIVRKLLFELATWHGLAKLRLHTETRVTDLENSATRLGRLRKFKSEVCSAYATRDLPSEEAARGRRKAAKDAKGGKKPEPPVASTGKKKKKKKKKPLVVACILPEFIAAGLHSVHLFRSHLVHCTITIL
jgi:hypothetical protein